MTQPASSLLTQLNYGPTVSELFTRDFDVKTGNIINDKYSKGVCVISFGSSYARFSLSMQNDYQKFADMAINQKMASNVCYLNITKNTDILTYRNQYKWPFTLDTIPRNLFYADGKPCYVHDTDYTYQSFLDSLAKVNAANPQCQLD